MSGGSFDYAYSRVVQFADELGVRLDQHDRVDEWGCKPNQFEPAILAKLREIEHLARRTAALMREVEWLYSGDTGDDSFMERVESIESQGEIQRLQRALAFWLPSVPSEETARRDRIAADAYLLGGYVGPWVDAESLGWISLTPNDQTKGLG